MAFSCCKLSVFLFNFILNLWFLALGFRYWLLAIGFSLFLQKRCMQRLFRSESGRYTRPYVSTGLAGVMPRFIGGITPAATSRQRQFEEKRASHPNFTFNPDFSALGQDKIFADSQA